MPYVVAGLVLVGLISTINLILTTAMVRRMRTYERGWRPSSIGGLRPGSPLPLFRASTSSGDLLTDRDLRGVATLVGFLSTDCAQCLERAPEFVTRAESILAEGGRAVAVIIEGAGEVKEYAAAVGPATVVVEPADRSGALSKAFGVDTFPSFVVDNDAITERELDPRRAAMIFSGQ